ncbi:hypothetical protein T265_14008, partial [Opisthorchis viverrini]
TVSVPSCHATRRKQECWDVVRLPKPRQGSRETEVEFESRIFRSVDSRSKHLSHLTLFKFYILVTDCPIVKYLFKVFCRQNFTGAFMSASPVISRRFSVGFVSSSKYRFWKIRRKHDGLDTVSLPKPRQKKSRGRVRVRTTDLLVGSFAL